MPPRESLDQTLKMRIRPDTFAYIPLALPAFREAGRCDLFTERSDDPPKRELLLEVRECGHWPGGQQPLSQMERFFR